MIYLKVTFDVDNPTALEKEKPVQSQLPWCQLFVICDGIVVMEMIKELMLVVTMKAPLRMIDCDIPGTLTALSLTGLRWRRQRGDIRRLRIISIPRRDEIGWMKIDNIHVSFRWRSWAQTTWPCRPC